MAAPTTADVFRKARAGTLTPDELDAWLSAVWPGPGIFGEVFFRASFLPLLGIIKASDPQLKNRVGYEPQSDSVYVILSNGAHSVYPLSGVRDQNLKERIQTMLGYLHDIPIVGQVLTAGEFLGKLANFIFSAKFPEFVAGTALLIVGVNAMLKGKPADAARQAIPRPKPKPPVPKADVHIHVPRSTLAAAKRQSVKSQAKASAKTLRVKA